MNKRLKKKRKLETAIVMLIAENAMQAEAIKNQNRQIAELRSIIQQNAQAINREFEAVKSATLDNQAAIKSIGDEVAVIKNKKWWFKKRS
ncbi:hypothetical protein [Streptococcus dysgalactiae]|uniref:hypothetical protein n=1 Tax=Streptococcus dysgalactiae TaxID=1334 RepID=UPI0001AAB79B|nr:hypothetical protein [Streptococcus dysgalactiae]KKC16951.1 hypothetical protein WH81_07215 [Streptococcus dysgalactiae subsp. equisimilis]TYK93761.1 hypothetical protein E0F69_00330 [Streptococcus dysgalactiae]WEQ88400.1 hypothetical protein MGCS35823_01748 [Streptococcus dysgalactiae subsp. equisimilis]SQG93507.1 phage protein [Streptococcus dysgalactiae subsp. equisimilis]BAH81629.1 hypothetical phage protein [Streptococcus dysgalactiae subsp. equisimilis GGS_124]